MILKEAWYREAFGDRGELHRLQKMVERGEASPDEKDSFWRLVWRSGVAWWDFPEELLFDRMEMLAARAPLRGEDGEEFITLARGFFPGGLRKRGRPLPEVWKDLFWETSFQHGIFPSLYKPAYEERFEKVLPKAQEGDPEALLQALLVGGKSLRWMTLEMAKATPWDRVVAHPNAFHYRPGKWTYRIKGRKSSEATGSLMDLYEFMRKMARDPRSWEPAATQSPWEFQCDRGWLSSHFPYWQGSAVLGWLVYGT